MATVGLTAVDGAYAGLAFVSFLLFSLVVLDGIDSPPVCELQLMCGHYYLSDIAPSPSGWYRNPTKRLEWL